MGITINDIAEKAKVSRATVSLVLRDEDQGRVSSETAARVRQVMREMNYRPNVSARRMRAKDPGMTRTNSLGCLFHVVLENNVDSYFSEILSGCNAAASSMGQHILMGYGHAEASVLQAHMLELLNDKVDGWLIGAFSEPSLLTFFQRRRIPAVWVGSSMDMSGVITQVRGDDFQGSYLAIQHLTSLGHRRIACLTRSAEVGWVEQMIGGWKKALREAGVDQTTTPISYHYDDPNKIREIVTDLFEASKKKQWPTALFVRSDREAANVMQLLGERGLRIPEDVSVVGHDNLSFSGLSNPPLTTLSTPRHEIGRTAVRLLMDIIEGRQESPVTTMLPLQLVVRESTAPLQK